MVVAETHMVVNLMPHSLTIPRQIRHMTVIIEWLRLRAVKSRRRLLRPTRRNWQSLFPYELTARRCPRSR